MFQRIKRYFQFKYYRLGYRDGYYMACDALARLNGRFGRINDSDIMTSAQFYKSPGSMWFRAYYFGFKFGIEEAYGFYNSGDDPVNSGGSLLDTYTRIQKEFEEDLWDINNK